LGNEFTILFSLKLPNCPFNNDYVVFSDGREGVELSILEGKGVKKCRFVFKKYLSNEEK